MNARAARVNTRRDGVERCGLVLRFFEFRFERLRAVECRKNSQLVILLPPFGGSSGMFFRGEGGGGCGLEAERTYVLEDDSQSSGARVHIGCIDCVCIWNPSTSESHANSRSCVQLSSSL